jgi:hypothetical protein
MFGPYRVVAVTPAGRKRYMEILLKYLLRDRHLIDEYHVWVNTEDRDDLEYLDELERLHRGFVRLIRLDPTFTEALRTCLKTLGGSVPSWKLIGVFHQHCTDRATIYIRFDDDICYVAPDALETLLAFRVAHESYFAVYPNIINNPTVSYIHQRLGNIGTQAGIIAPDPFCAVALGGAMARFIHEDFFERLERAALDELKFKSWTVTDYTRVQVNCLTWFGRDFADYPGPVSSLIDEIQLSMEMPKTLQRPNCICGNAIVVHFAFYGQRKFIERKTSLLGRYRMLAGLDDVTVPAVTAAATTSASGLDPTRYWIDR